MRKAFTFIEIMIAIIVLAILAGLALPQYLRWAEASRMLEGKINIDRLLKLERAYYFENGRWGIYNASQDDLKPEPPIPPTSCNETSYYRYNCIANPAPDPTASCFASRCTSGGKPPNYRAPGLTYYLSANSGGDTCITRYPPGKCPQGSCHSQGCQW